MNVIRGPRAILALLTGLNLLNYLDRYVLSAVLPEVEHDLGLSKFVGGSLATIFLVGYFATSPIFGTLADRGARKGLIALGIVVWSAATIATGLTRTTWALIAARAVVGVGEASYATLAPTIIDDLAPPEKRSRWLAVFYAAIPIGGALGYAVGSAIGKAHGWRTAFFIAGGPGIVLALLCLLIQEPERRLSVERPEAAKSARILAAIARYRQGVLGYAAYTFALGGFAYWAPSFLKDTYHQDLGVQFGAVSVVGGAIGTVIGGRLGDRATRRQLGRLLGGTARDPTEAEKDQATTAGNLQVCAWSCAIGVPFTVGCFFASTATQFFVYAFFAEVALFVLNAPINAVILRSVPSELRASAMALSIFAIHLLGDLWSPPLIGFFADRAGMLKAMMAVPVGFALATLIWGLRTRNRGLAATSG